MRGRGRGMRGSRGGAGVGPGVGGPRRNPYMDPYMPYYYPPYGYDGALYFRCVTHESFLRFRRLSMFSFLSYF